MATEKLSGTKDLEVELLPDNGVRLTMRYRTALEATVAYDAIREQCRAGALRLRMTLGETLEEDGPMAALG